MNDPLAAPIDEVKNPMKDLSSFRTRAKDATAAALAALSFVESIIEEKHLEGLEAPLAVEAIKACVKRAADEIFEVSYEARFGKTRCDPGGPPAPPRDF